MNSSTPREPHPAHHSLYPTMESIVAAVQYIESKVPVTTTNEMFALLMLFQNTVLQELCSPPCVVYPMPRSRGDSHGTP